MLSAISQEEALNDFGEALKSVYGPFGVEPTVRNESSGQLALRRYGPFEATEASINSMKLDRSDRGLRDDCLFAVLQRSGQSFMQQNGHESIMRPHDIVVVEPRRGCNLLIQKNSDLLTFHIDRLSFGTISIAQCGRRIDGSKGMGNLLSSTLTSLVEASAHFDADDCAVATEAIVALLGRAMSFQSPIVPDEQDSDLVAKMRAWTLAHLDDLDVRPRTLADAFGISRRQVYRLFGARGTTPSCWLWNLRLDVARARLGDARYSGLSITKIAFSVGFNDAAHFSHAFRRRFGIAPRAVRSNPSGA